MCELNRLMYFRHDADSFNATGKWLTELRDHADSNIVVLLAGNKNDLAHLRTVSAAQAQQFAHAEELSTVETSALDATNVEQAFIDLLTQTYSVMCKAQDDVTATTARPQDFIELSDASNQNMKKCCQ
mmetsp:Transcript_6834/g.27437  ORF Transcript_6834/g.27437 Transcript_6834/m.27437 type:complete len:128 (+) Transcript_6834:3097-3480(+)